MSLLTLANLLETDGLESGFRGVLQFLGTAELLRVSEVSKSLLYYREFLKSVQIRSRPHVQQESLANFISSTTRARSFTLERWDDILLVMFGLQERGNCAIDELCILQTAAKPVHCGPWIRKNMNIVDLCSNLKKLTLPKGSTYVSNWFLAEIASGKCPELRDITIQESVYQDSFLKATPLLERIDAAGCYINESFIADLASGTVPHVRYLNLSRCQTFYTFDLLLDGLSKDVMPQLEFLDLSWNDLYGDKIYNLGQALCDGKMRNLRVLRLQGILSNEDGTRKLFQGITSHGRLEELNYSNNNVSSNSASLLAPCLKFLHRLEIRCVFLEQTAAAVIGQTLAESKFLRYLDVSGNEQMGDAGFQNIASQLDKCPVLEDFLASHSLVGWRSLSCLSCTLPGCKQLKSIDLSYSSEEGRKSNLGSLVSNIPQSVECLNLSRVLSNSGARSLVACVTEKRFPNLRTLTLKDCYFNGCTTLALARSLTKENCPLLSCLEL